MSYWFSSERRLPHERLKAITWIIFGTAALLFAGFWNLQILEYQRYAELAERNRVRSIPIIAPRGRMLDREGRVLVDSYPSQSVLLLRDDPQEVNRLLPQIAEGLELPLQDLQEQIEAARAMPKFQPMVIKHEATLGDVAFIESHRPDIPVLELLLVQRRKYPSAGFLSHAIGYVGEVSEQQIEKSKGRLRPGDIVGKAGIERQYNETLMGTDGLRRVIVNSVGKEVGRLDQTEAIPGKPVKLTIDYDLQQVAEAALASEGKKGAVVALDPRSGEILAMASHPAPDPNAFAVRIRREDWKELNEDTDHPMLNRAIQAQLAPGSVFKIVMATAMLESKAIPEDFTAFCPGHADFYGRTFKCHIWKKGGHGVVGLHKAVVQSCDVFFYNVGKRLGIDRIAEYAQNLGMGKKTGVDLPGEEAGLVPSSKWKERVFKQKWYAGETISVAVGQGAVQATPLQLARLLGGVAMGGIFKQPHLLKSLPNSKQLEEVRFPLEENTVEKVTQALFGVVNEGGTAAGSRLEGIEFCGKTGTAQLISSEGLAKAGKSRQFTDNAWFVGYAPRRNPEIVVAVLVEHGEHGSSAAAPVAKEIVKAYYDKKGRKNQQQYTVAFKKPLEAPEPLLAESPAAEKPESPRVKEVPEQRHR